MSEYRKQISQNRKAPFNYFIEEKIEVGIVLTGSELKSIRQGKVNIEDAHSENSGNEIFLYNCHIAEYDKARNFGHSAKRVRKLLLHKSEIRKLIGKIRIKGYTLIPLSMYFNEKNIVKVELGLGKGKKLHDKRESLKQKDWTREQQRVMRGK